MHDSPHRFNLSNTRMAGCVANVRLGTLHSCDWITEVEGTCAAGKAPLAAWCVAPVGLERGKVAVHTASLAFASFPRVPRSLVASARARAWRSSSRNLNGASVASVRSPDMHVVLEPIAAGLGRVGAVC